MPATELAEWALFYAENPFGEFRADLRAGIVATVIARTMGGSKAATPSDFMPFLKNSPEARPSPASARAREAAMVNQAFMTASSRLPHRVIKRRKGNSHG